MKRHNSLIIGLALLLGSGFIATAQSSKIGTIDLRKTFDGYWKTKQADANLKERAADLDKARAGMVEDLKKSTEDLKKLDEATKDPAIAAAERDKRKKAAEDKLLELRQMEQNIQAFNRQATTTLGEQQRRLRDNILKEIRDLVTAKAKAKGFGLLIDTAANSVDQTPIVMFNTGENDITDEILKELNANAPAIVPSASTVPAPAPAPAAEKK